jgi:biotin carboxyl carrier protein
MGQSQQAHIVSDPDTRLRAAIDGETLEVRLGAAGEVSIAADGGETTVFTVDAGGADPARSWVAITRPPSTGAATHLDDGANALRARVALIDGVAWVFIDGDVFQIELSDAQAGIARRRERAGQEALAAPMPATVTRILVEVGQAVARGDTLLLLEAMKMEMPIKAPADGRITAIRCRTGELVQPGAPLVDVAGVD